MFSPELLAVVGTVFSAGAAWGGAKVALNGTKNRVKDIKEDLVKHTAADLVIQTQMIDRLARIETKLDMIHERSKYEGPNRS